MMFCLICNLQIYTDNVISTDCGHVMHVSCFRTWRKTSSECPECKVNLLKGENTTPRLKPTENISENLLSAQTDEVASNESRRDSSLDHVENDKPKTEVHTVDQGTVNLNTHRRIAELERENAGLCKENEILNNQKRQLTDYFNRKIDLLQKKVNDNGTEQLQKECTQLKEKLKLETRQKDALERKLSDMQLALQKEKRHSTELTEAKIKLETTLKRTAAYGNKGIEQEDKTAIAGAGGCATVLEEVKGIAAPRDIIPQLIHLTNEKLQQIRLELQKEKEHAELSVGEIELESMKKPNTASGDIVKSEQTNQKVAGSKIDEKKLDQKKTANANTIRHGVVLKGCTDIAYPRETVLKVAELLKFDVGQDDIEDIVLNRQSNNVSLIVAFKTKALQDRFMTQAKKLKHIPELKQIDFCYYSATTDLLAYAKQLKNVGYEFVATHKNRVCARKDSKSQYITILSKEEVDELMKLPTSSDAKQVNALKPEQPSASATRKLPLTAAYSKDPRTNVKHEAHCPAPSDNPTAPNVSNQWRTSNKPGINPNAQMHGVWTPNVAATQFQTQFPAPNANGQWRPSNQSGINQNAQMHGMWTLNPEAPNFQPHFPGAGENPNFNKQHFKTTPRPAIVVTERNFPAPRGNQKNTRVNNQGKQVFKATGPHTPRQAPGSTEHQLRVPSESPNPPRQQWKNPFRTDVASAPKAMIPKTAGAPNGIPSLPNGHPRNRPNIEKVIKPSAASVDCDDEFYAP